MYKRSVKILVLAAASAVAAFAQASFTGSILAAATDPSGAAIPNASVTVTNLATNEVVRLKSNAAGFQPVAMGLRPTRV